MLHYSHNHLNEQRPVHVEKEAVRYWKIKVTKIERQLAQSGEKVVWVMVEGFLLYWHLVSPQHKWPSSLSHMYNLLDVCLLFQAPKLVLRDCRVQWKGYHPQVRNIVYPSYVRAHKDLFQDGDMDTGTGLRKMPDLLVFDGVSLNMTELLDRTCQQVVTALDLDLD